MKNFFLLTVVALFFGPTLRAQISPSRVLAEKIAQKMMDSLSLSPTQKELILGINLRLHEQKLALRQQFTVRDSVAIGIQKVENGRDALYKEVLTTQQFETYRQKKRNLVTNR